MEIEETWGRAMRLALLVGKKNPQPGGRGWVEWRVALASLLDDGEGRDSAVAREEAQLLAGHKVPDLEQARVAVHGQVPAHRLIDDPFQMAWAIKTAREQKVAGRSREYRAGGAARQADLPDDFVEDIRVVVGAQGPGGPGQSFERAAVDEETAPPPPGRMVFVGRLEREHDDREVHPVLDDRPLQALRELFAVQEEERSLVVMLQLKGLGQVVVVHDPDVAALAVPFDDLEEE